MNFLILAGPNASDRHVDNFLRNQYGVQMADHDVKYTVIRSREDWEPNADKDFDFWTKIGDADAWTQLRVVEKHGEPLEQKLVRLYFLHSGRVGPIPPLGTH